MNYAIITSAGSGKRAGLKIDKNLFFLDGSTVIEKTVAVFLKIKKIDKIIVTVPQKNKRTYEKLLNKLSPKITVVCGGETRTESVKNALDLCTGGYVLIHDGARPFVSEKLVKKCLYKAINEGNCVPTLPVTDTLSKVNNGKIESTCRDGFLRAQTPQVFKTEEIKKAYSKLEADDVFTDDCGVYCKYIGAANFICGEVGNIKLTYKKDFENLIPKRTGIGYDLHTLVYGRKLMLGGVKIPHDKGLLGHSDADVVIHALMDAMLSACALKDIGHYFPDTDPNYKDISGIILLKKVLKIIKKQGYKPINASLVIMAEKPKLSPYVENIKCSLANILKIKPSDIGITCTTAESVGLVGREEAIACYATATLG